MELGEATALIGALGVGSVVGALIGQGRDRREARAEALDAVRAVEDARWAPGSKAELEEALRVLAVAALLAQLPRRPVREYTILARVAWRSSVDGFDETQGAFGGEAINQEFNRLVRRAASLVVAAVWQPWVARVLMPVWIAALRVRLRLVDNEEVRERLAASRRRL